MLVRVVSRIIGVCIRRLIHRRRHVLRVLIVYRIRRRLPVRWGHIRLSVGNS